MKVTSIMEVELRAKITDKNSIKNKLAAIGANYVKRDDITDYYFGNIPLYEKLGHSFWIRVRVTNNSVVLAYKGPTATDGVYEEYEQTLQDEKTALTILRKMGLDNPITIKKQRETYTLQNISILIDSIENKGLFIELEAIAETSDKRYLFEVMDKLEINKSDIFEKGFITLFLAEEHSPFSKWVIN